jgi:hypothetical protein
MYFDNNVVSFKRNEPEMIDMQRACKILGMGYDALYQKIKKRKIEYFQDEEHGKITFEIDTIFKYKESMRKKTRG